MFDIGFWELALIGVVALLVVGPDRLPGLARTVGLWVGRIRRYVSSVRDDIEREIQAEELRKMLDKPNDLNPLQEVVDETVGSIGDAKKELAQAEKSAEALMSEEPPGTSASSASEDDGTAGADDMDPQAAATRVGEAMTASGDAAAEAPGEVVEDTESHERRSG